MRVKDYVRLTLAGTAALAAAGTAGATTLPIPAAQAFYFSGSTAMDNPIKFLFVHGTGGICNFTSPHTVDVYTDNSAASLFGGHNNMVVCDLNVAIGSFTAGTTVALDKESNGGSQEGIYPVATGGTLKFFSATAAPTCANTTTVAATGSSGTYTLHYGCTVNGTIAPQIGVADENVEAFDIGSPSVGPAQIAKLKYTQFAQNVFGIAVSLDLFRALQRAQGLALDDTLAHRPTLSSLAIRSLYTGGVVAWTNLTDASGNAINSATDNGGTAAPATVYLCRRGETSGTETSVDIYFIGNRCTQAAASPIPILTATTPNDSTHCTGQLTAGTPEEYGCAWSSAENAGDVVFAGFGGGDVAACLTYHDTQGQFAIGNLTTNQAEADLNGLGGTGDTNSSTNGRFRFVKINGKSPDLGSVVNGTYDYVFDNILVTQNNTVAERDALVNYLLTDFFSSSTLAEAIMNTQPGDTNFTAGVLMDQLNPVYKTTSGAPAANSTPPYVTGAAVKSGAGGVTPVSPLTFLSANSSDPQNCIPSFFQSNNVPTNP